MRMIGLALVVAFAIAPAQAMEMNVDSPWSVWSTEVKVTLSATALRRNATTGALEAISGQRVSIGPITFLQKSLGVTFPGQRTTAMNVAGVRLYHSANGVGWVMPEHPINVTFPEIVVVPAGSVLSCTYSMPIISYGKITCAAGP